MNVPKVRNAKRLIIGLKNFIILINIKLSFALLLLKRQESVNMAITAHLHILNQKFLQSSLTSFLQIRTSICSILRLFGVLTMKINTSVINVFMHITGKILGGSHNCIIIQRSNVVTGVLKSILAITEMDAKMNTDATILMDGRNSNTIRKTISLINAKMLKTV